MTTERTWSAQQQAIFDEFATGTGNVAVIARAGSGKTTSILEAVKFAPEKSIMLCAFNKKIATELQTRLKDSNPAAEAKTLHSIGFSYVMRAWKGVKVDADRGWDIARKVAGPKASKQIVNLIAKLASRCKGTVPFGTVQDIQDEALDADILPSDEDIREGYNLNKLAEKVLEAMDLACQENGTLDFDDMIFVALRNNLVRPKWKLVVVDEAQDMSNSQLLLAQQICMKDGRIVVVGDDKQAIYGFRGADHNSINRLIVGLNAKVMKLTTTYRCPVAVVELAAQLVPDLMAAPGAPLGVVENTSRSKLVTQAEANDFVLSRANAPLVGLCLAFLKANKRARIEGKDIGRTLINLVRNFKATSIENFLNKLNQWKERELSRAENLPERNRDNKIALIMDQADCLIHLSEGMADVRALENRITMLFDDVAEGNDKSFIVCSSVHRAKGLERKNVFLVEETFNGNGIENQNIKYVALTRAQERLVWVKQD